MLRYPRLCYAVRGIQMRVRPPARTMPPVRHDVASYEHLFASSVERFEVLVRPWRPEFVWSAGRTNNGTFESVDIELYHSVLRTHRPKLVIEVGGGHSSHFSTQALRSNGSGEVVVVDPRPRVRLPRGVTHVRSRVEDVDLALFDRLGSGDVLFVDSSHTTEEARYHAERILPRLAGGVLVQHHDVLFPYDSYYLDDPAVYGEQDVLLEYYSAQTGSFDVLIGAAYVRYRDRALLEDLVPSYRWQPSRVPGSLWVRKRQPGTGV